MKNTNSTFLLIAFLLLLLNSCKDDNYQIVNNNLVINVNDKLQTNIESKLVLNPGKDYSSSEFITINENDISEFKFLSAKQIDFVDSIGKGVKHIIIGIYNKNKINIEKIVEIAVYEKFKDIAFFNVEYINKGKEMLSVEKWVNNNYTLERNEKDTTFWSFQGSSTSARADWILPLGKGFSQKNYLGMNNSDYGGGIPVLDIWRSDYGIAIGHTELVPRLVSTPLETNEQGNKANFWIEYEYSDGFEFNVGDTLTTYETFVTVHKGDCFVSLNKFTGYMQSKGIKFVEPEEEAYEAVWCAWGYERNFTIDEIIGTLPKVKELGIKWAVIDDGFQIAEGDWNVNKEKFPGGNKQMKALVDKIHSYGLKAKLWWAPLAADPCTDFVKNNRDAIITNEEDVPRYITWWDSYYMSSAAEKTITHTNEVLDLFIDEWGFDGLKMDGQHMNAAPENHNWKQKGTKPIDAVEQVPAFFKNIYEYTTKKKKDAVIENCPCGCCMSFYNMPYMNQAVSSDPTSSWQIRMKGKVYKAIIGKTAYYGDHVELSDNGNDFASSFGVGAVLGTKFTWPKDNPTAGASYLLTAEKEAVWKKWFTLYNEKMLSKEPYLGSLYDIGFDKPETHVIKKNDTMYYAFYAKEWSGKLELRGLENGKYKIYDYYNEKDYGTIISENPEINVEFSKFLLLKVTPK